MNANIFYFIVDYGIWPYHMHESVQTKSLKVLKYVCMLTNIIL